MKLSTSVRVEFVLLSLLVGFVVPPAPHAGAASVFEKLAPSSGALFGVYAKPRAGRTHPQEVAYLEDQLSRKFDIDHFYYRFYHTLPTPEIDQSAQMGKIPFVNWKPVSDASETPVLWDAIARGDYDLIIGATADRFAQMGSPVFMAFHHEPENDVGTFGTSADYVAAWRHIVGIFRDRGAQNVVWVWTMMGWTFDPQSGRDPDAYYPGDDVIDWIGTDCYNWYPGKSGSVWRAFADACGPGRLYAIGHGKPLAIVETGVQEDPALGGRKAQWYVNALAQMKLWPDVKAWVYFNSDKIYPWWFDSSTSAAASFREMALDPYLNPRSQATSAPVNVSPPVISGLARDGQSLAASTGGWTNVPTLYAWQWERCDASGANCTAIYGATDPGYMVISADVGGALRVAVTAANALGSSVANSDPTALVAAVAPLNTALPAISGTAAVGQTLSLSAGSWIGTEPISSAYEWRRCTSAGSCFDILDANGNSYAITPDDLDYMLAANVIATNSAGSTTSVSALIGPVAEKTVTVASPKKGKRVKRYSVVEIRTAVADGFRVKKVQTWVNGRLKCSDRRSPYVCAWFVRPRPGTRNRIRVVAYDKSGNTAVARTIVTTVSSGRT